MKKYHEASYLCGEQPFAQQVFLQEILKEMLCLFAYSRPACKTVSSIDSVIFFIKASYQHSISVHTDTIKIKIDFLNYRLIVIRLFSKKVYDFLVFLTLFYTYLCIRINKNSMIEDKAEK